MEISIVMLLLSMIMIVTTRAQTPNSGGNETWAKRVDTGSQVVTTLQFYFHDTLSGRNPSAIKIAQDSQGNNLPNQFGNLLMVDDPLTEGPEPTSKLVGHARGMYGSAGQTDFGLIMVLNYGFVDGIYDGSSFSLLSINPVMQSVREMAIVGGTGLFRLARGYALAQTYSADPSTADAVVHYNVTIVTYI